MSWISSKMGMMVRRLLNELSCRLLNEHPKHSCRLLNELSSTVPERRMKVNKGNDGKTLEQALQSKLSLTEGRYEQRETSHDDKDKVDDLKKEDLDMLNPEEEVKSN
ncbi:hypothetical protein U1Q18_014167 [Sarracenia purpurea var. burkii]